MDVATDGLEAGSAALALLDLIPCPAWLHDAETLRLLYCNRAARDRLGLPCEHPGWTVLEVHPEWSDPPPVPLRREAPGPQRLVARDGTTLLAEITARLVTAAGRSAWLVVANDLVDRGEAARALAAAEARYQSLFHNAVEGIFQTSPDGRYLDANPALARIYGYESPGALMESITDISRQLYVDPARRDEFVRLMRRQDVVEGFESQIIRRDGAMVWISESVRAVRDSDGSLLHYEGTVIDITQRKLAEAQLRHDASHDKLTGLPNRAWFMRATEAALSHSGPGSGCAILFVDLDRFKLINDSLGHLAGDQLLVGIARRLSEVVRPEDMVARLGGDEFAVLLADVRSLEAAIPIADRVQRSFRQPFEVGSRKLFVTASVGIALGDASYTCPEDLLRDADVAMYRAKARGRARRELFDSRMRDEVVERLQLETDLRSAVERGQLVLHYQPVVHLETGRTVAFEALVRWNHPRRGLIYPGEFIPVAEETGDILEIGRWVVEAACRQAAEWERRGGPVLPVSVNVSSKQFMQPEFAVGVGEVLDTAGLTGDRLKVEITETVLMENSRGVARMLGSLRRRGVGICLDDFGTGFSSLSYLQRFPIDQIKIDRAFVARIGSGRASGEILKAIVNLSSTLGMEAVAEGVETPYQARELQRLGCVLAQGYQFSPPLPPELAARQWRG